MKKSLFLKVTVLGLCLAVAGHAFAYQPAANIPTGEGTSQNWAGYIATGGNYTTISGTWTVPTAVPSATVSADATWVGIGGTSSGDLIQAGTQAQPNAAGQMTYQAWYELLPQNSQTVALAVNPGDSITTTLTEEGTNVWLITISDNTRATYYQTTVDYASSLSSAEWVEEMPSNASGALIPLDDFGTVYFSNAYVVQNRNGSELNLAQAGAFPVSIVETDGQILAEPSSLGSNDESFSVVRTNGIVATVPAAATGTVPQQGYGRGFPHPYRRIGVGVQGLGFPMGSGTMVEIQTPSGTWSVPLAILRYRRLLTLTQ